VVFYISLPVEAILEDSDATTVSCEGCKCDLDSEACLDGRGGLYCESCIEILVSGWRAEAVEYARENCKITRIPEAYDPCCEFRVTPEEYSMGERESYSPNAYSAHCRHVCTNYDELVRPLDRDDAEDRVYYWAIRRQVYELLAAEVPDFNFSSETDYDP
jgi:hypothetical protein